MTDLILRDLGYALRRLHRTPLFSLITILTLGLAIGAATTVFSVVNSVLLRPLSYGAAERLVMVWNDFGQGAQSLPAVSATDYLDYRTETTLFDGFAAGTGPGAVGAGGILTGEGQPERVDVTPVSANFLPLFGVEPMLGRQFTEAEERFQGPKVVMMTHGLWQRRYGGDPAIVGRNIQLDGVSYEVVGVLPPGFRLELPAEVYQIRSGEIWTPLQFDRSDLPSRNTTTFTAFGRLKIGVTLAQAQAEMDGLAAKFRATYPEHQGTQVRIRLIPLKQDVVKAVKPGILTLLAAVCVLVVIACANIANLLLARAAARAREFSIRAAVGAGRPQMLRQLLIEGGVLAMIGGALGLGLTAAALALLPRVSPADLPRLTEISVDWRSASFTVALCLVTTLAFGLAPALYALGDSAGAALRAGGRIATLRQGTWLTRALVSAEIALCLVLLIGSGLLVRSFLELRRVRPGFEADGALSFQLALPRATYPNGPARAAFYDELERRLGTIPGVTAVGRASQLPLTGSGSLSPYAYNEETARNWESVTAEGRGASPDYFRAIGTRLLAGRFFTREDAANNGTPGAQVIIIDESLARRVWPGGNAVGQQLQINPTGDPNAFATVVGVVEYTRIRELAADGLPQIYYPLWPGREASYVVRTAGDPAALSSLVRSEIAAMDPSLALSHLGPMRESVVRAMDGHRLSLFLMQGVAGLALLLGTIGVYGVIAQSVGQREREFGVRVALGQSPGGLERMVVFEGARLVLPSLAAGLLLALAATRLMRGLLYGISPTDGLTFGVVPLVLGTVAFAACYLPARRASRVSPLIILRGE